MHTMTFDIRRWGVGHLVGSWAVYWAGLAAVKLTPFALLVWKISRGPGDHGTVSASLGTDGIVLTALKDGATVFNATAPVVPTALWIAVPPLAIWAVWLAVRPSRAERDALEPRPQREALPDARSALWDDRAAHTPSPLPVERRENRG
jgi:hypothetical protein